jgi:hypothetical protein
MIARAFVPGLIMDDGRVIAQTTTRDDVTLTPEAAVEAALTRILERPQQLSVAIPPFGLVSLWPGICRLSVTSGATYAAGSPDGQVYIVTDVDYDLIGRSATGHITATVTGRRADAVAGIETETALYPAGTSRSENRANDRRPSPVHAASWFVHENQMNSPCGSKQVTGWVNWMAGPYDRNPPPPMTARRIAPPAPNIDSCFMPSTMVPP